MLDLEALVLGWLQFKVALKHRQSRWPAGGWWIQAHRDLEFDLQILLLPLSLSGSLEFAASLGRPDHTCKIPQHWCPHTGNRERTSGAKSWLAWSPCITSKWFNPNPRPSTQFTLEVSDKNNYFWYTLQCWHTHYNFQIGQSKWFTEKLYDSTLLQIDGIACEAGVLLTPSWLFDWTKIIKKNNSALQKIANIEKEVFLGGS